MNEAKPMRIHHETDFEATPKRLYEALLDEKQFAACTGLPAQIDRQAGGAFSMFDGRIVGRNIELIANQRVVQAWRNAMWPAGVYSIVRFELNAQGSGTRIIFDHTGFPPENHDDLDSGWTARYWEPLKKYL